MTEQEFFAKAMIASMQGLLSAVGSGYEAEYVDAHATVAAMARDYAQALTTRYVIESSKMKLESANYSCRGEERLSLIHI